MTTVEYFMLCLPYKFHSIRNGCDTVRCPGWVAVTAHAEEKLLLRAYTPEGTALVVREPPLLPYISAVRGARIPGTAAYRTKKPPSLVENLKTTERR
ncbi:PREDICTED: nitric oxide-associated protein 1-like isoform X2 [Calidris pugnax]|uniref:nitric oxide-associated protein 1-like isoform X2 n=1 Tax=Calidris pugnax TaxID=198806 RepID=UPI00071E2A8E|nr:PREDICTED: nitric oxide-associated protein 1-like isoform X2 [Calidris pugnax]